MKNKQKTVWNFQTVCFVVCSVAPPSDEGGGAAQAVTEGENESHNQPFSSDEEVFASSYMAIVKADV